MGRGYMNPSKLESLQAYDWMWEKRKEKEEDEDARREEERDN